MGGQPYQQITKIMHKVLYDRIAKYAKDIESGNPLPRFCRPWQQDGLETARSIYEYIKFGEKQTAKEIAQAFEVSPEYAKQVILALQNGGAKIQAVPENLGKQHRPTHKYFVLKP